MVIIICNLKTLPYCGCHNLTLADIFCRFTLEVVAASACITFSVEHKGAASRKSPYVTGLEPAPNLFLFSKSLDSVFLLYV